MQTIISFFNDLFTIIGYFTALLLCLSFIGGVCLWVKGILPVWWRLGFGLARRKVAIFASENQASKLKSLVAGSGLFSKKNIFTVQPGDLDEMSKATVFLIYWPDFEDEIVKVLEKKKASTAVVVYAPQEEGFIPKEVMSELNKFRNITIVNFRGRLLNDMVLSMITTACNK